MTIAVGVKRWVGGVLLSAAAMLGSCSSDNDNDNFVLTILQSFLFFDFPGSFANPSTTLGISTTGNGQGMNVYGVTIATGADGLLTPLEFTLNENTAPFNTQPVLDLNGVFRWQQTIPTISPETTLGLGLNQFLLRTTSANDLVFNEAFAIIRGTTWMRETAIQFDANRNRWLVLDWARRALLEIDLGTGAKTIVSDVANGTGAVDFLAPIDFVVDGDTAYVLDRDLQAILAVDLTIGGTEGDRSIYSQANIPVATPAVNFGRPIALELDSGSQRMFVLDRDLDPNQLIEVDMSAGGVRSVRTFTGVDDMGDPDPDAPQITQPVDLAYYAANDELYIADTVLNGLIRVTLATNDLDEFLSPDPEENVAFSVLRRAMIESDTLYVTDAAPRIVEVNLAVDPSPGADPRDGPGDRNFLSGLGLNSFGQVAAVPNPDNLNRLPGALAIDTANDQLLVVDNLLGNLVTVALSDDNNGTPSDDTDDLPKGRRSYIAGGATSEDADVVAYRSAPLLFNMESPVDLLADLTSTQLTTLDAANNRLVIVSSLQGESTIGAGSRGFLGQNSDSPVETNFVDPRAIEFFGLDYFVVDAATDRVIQVPLDGTARSVVSDETTTLVFDDPIDMVIRDADPDPEVDDIRLYVLDRGRGEIIEVAVADGARSIVVDSLVDPAAMVYNADPENSIDEIVVLIKDTNSLCTVDLSVALPSTCNFLKSYGAIDAFGLALDSRASDAADYQVLTVDLATSEVVPTGIGFNNRTQPIGAAYMPVSNTADTFIAPVAMGFNATSEKLYVIDEAIRSVFIVDLRWRNISTNVPVSVDNAVVGVDQVDAQRIVFSRGTALNCDPLADDYDPLVDTCEQSAP